MFKSQKELIQALMEGKKIRKDIWWSHCYLFMDEDGMIYDEEQHQYTLRLEEYKQFREIKPKDFKFMKYLMDIEINKLSCVCEDITCVECPLYIDDECVKGNLMEHIEECQKLLED